jgi:hypothetical protein
MKKGPGAPNKFIAALQTWLKASFGGKRFKSFGNSLKHVVQKDSYSCGIITANTIAHAILDHPLCNNVQAAQERIRWFIHFASLYQFKSVSATVIEDVDMTGPFAAPEDPSNIPNQARKDVMRIADLLNPIDPSELPTASGYDSDDSSDFEETSNIPLQPKPKPAISALKADNTSQKRPRPDSLTNPNAESSDGYESSTNSLASAEIKRTVNYVKAGEGTSRSAKASRAMREDFRDGSLKIKAWRIEAWKEKVLKDDPQAEFDPKDISRARHSGCGKYVKMKDPCNIGRWKDHIQACNKKSTKKHAGGTPSLFQLGWAKITQAGKKKKKISGANSDNSESESEPELKNVPCPGITVSDTPHVLRYLKRTGASGGGGRSLPVISKQLFKKLFSRLSKKENRKVVVDTQMQEWKWKNDHVNHRVYAITCQKTVVDRSPKPPHLCLECRIVLRSKAFKSAIQKPIPSDKNSKFINYRFRNPLLGSIYARTIGVREIVDDEVLFLVSIFSIPCLILSLECPIQSICSIRPGCIKWKIQQRSL